MSDNKLTDQPTWGGWGGWGEATTDQTTRRGSLVLSLEAWVQGAGRMCCYRGGRAAAEQRESRAEQSRAEQSSGE